MRIRLLRSGLKAAVPSQGNHYLPVFATTQGSTLQPCGLHNLVLQPNEAGPPLNRGLLSFRHMRQKHYTNISVDKLKRRTLTPVGSGTGRSPGISCSLWVNFLGSHGSAVSLLAWLKTSKQTFIPSIIDCCIKITQTE